METRICKDELDFAVELLERGEVVALPTETVYGLAADAMNPDAVLKIFEAKERPFFDPLIVHLPDLDWLERVTIVDEPLVKKLIEKFWPGPLTVVLPRCNIVPDIVTSGLQTVAVRMSEHPVFRAVIQKLGKPLAAPSANRFGRISPTAAEHVLAELNGRIPLIIDGGTTQHGVESTIVAVQNSRIEILRSGPVTREQLAEFGEVELVSRTENPVAPGQLKSHYAPRTPLRIANCRLRIADKTSALLAWNKPQDPALFKHIEMLSPTQNLREAAATLFAKMRKLDESGVDLIVAELVPDEGLGIAINDRLRKAATEPT